MSQLIVPPTHIQSLFFFFNDTATTEIYTLSLHDALPIFLHEGHTRAEVALGPEREPVWAIACIPHRERHVHGLPREDRAGRLGSHHPHTRHRFDFGDQRHHGHSLLADRRLQESPDDDVLVG